MAFPLLTSLFESLNKRALLELQTKLVESDLSDHGWDFELQPNGKLNVTNSRLPRHVAIGPLEHGLLSVEDTDAKRKASIVQYYHETAMNANSSARVVEVRISKLYDVDQACDATIIFASANDAFTGMLIYEGHSGCDPLDLVNQHGRFDSFVNNLLTAKNA